MLKKLIGLKYFFYSGVLILFILNAFSNCKNSTLSSGKNNLLELKKNFPGASDIAIDTLENGIQYSFLNGDIQTEVFFDSASNYKYAATYLEVNLLPEAIKSDLQKRFSLENINIAKRLKFADRVEYSVELETSTDFYLITYTESGKVMNEHQTPLNVSESAAQEDEGVEND